MGDGCDVVVRRNFQKRSQNGLDPTFCRDEDRELSRVSIIVVLQLSKQGQKLRMKSKKEERTCQLDDHIVTHN